MFREETKNKNNAKNWCYWQCEQRNLGGAGRSHAIDKLKKRSLFEAMGWALTDGKSLKGWELVGFTRNQGNYRQR